MAIDSCPKVSEMRPPQQPHSCSKEPCRSSDLQTPSSAHHSEPSLWLCGWAPLSSVEISAWNWTPSCIYIGLINEMTPGDQDQPSAQPKGGGGGSEEERITLSSTAGSRGCITQDKHQQDKPKVKEMLAVCVKTFILSCRSLPTLEGTCLCTFCLPGPASLSRVALSSSGELASFLGT